MALLLARLAKSINNRTTTVQGEHLVLAWMATPIAYYLFFAELGADPSEVILKGAGTITIRLFLFNMFLGAFWALWKPKWLRPFLRYRRPLGVATFAYAAVHFVIYLIREGLFGILDKTYLVFGAGALLGLIVLAVTSNDLSVRRLGGPLWKKLHRTVYVIGLLIALHILWIEKFDPLWLQIYLVPIGALQSWRLIRYARTRISSPTV